MLKECQLTSSMTERLGPRKESLCFQSLGGLSVLCIEPAITCRHCLKQEVAAAYLQIAKRFITIRSDSKLLRNVGTNLPECTLFHDLVDKNTNSL